MKNKKETTDTECRVEIEGNTKIYWVGDMIRKTVEASADETVARYYSRTGEYYAQIHKIPYETTFTRYHLSGSKVVWWYYHDGDFPRTRTVFDRFGRIKKLSQYSVNAKTKHGDERIWTPEGREILKRWRNGRLIS